MIFGTADFFNDVVTGERLQVCVCDAHLPDLSVQRILVCADKGSGYFLPPPMNDRYDIMMTGTGKELIAILTLRNIIEVKDERELT